jgi:uncharacterized membrane protein
VITRKFKALIAEVVASAFVFCGILLVLAAPMVLTWQTIKWRKHPLVPNADFKTLVNPP